MIMQEETQGKILTSISNMSLKSTILKNNTPNYFLFHLDLILVSRSICVQFQLRFRLFSDTFEYYYPCLARHCIGYIACENSDIGMPKSFQKNSGIDMFLCSLSLQGFIFFRTC